ncbi:MAG: hypothetical protein ABI629_07150 [bacterium]
MDAYDSSSTGGDTKENPASVDLHTSTEETPVSKRVKPSESHPYAVPSSNAPQQRIVIESLARPNDAAPVEALKHGDQTTAFRALLSTAGATVVRIRNPHPLFVEVHGRFPVAGLVSEHSFLQAGAGTQTEQQEAVQAIASGVIQRYGPLLGLRPTDTLQLQYIHLTPHGGSAVYQRFVNDIPLREGGVTVTVADGVATRIVGALGTLPFEPLASQPRPVSMRIAEVSARRVLEADPTFAGILAKLGQRGPIEEIHLEYQYDEPHLVWGVTFVREVIGYDRCDVDAESGEAVCPATTPQGGE